MYVRANTYINVYVYRAISLEMQAILSCVIKTLGSKRDTERKLTWTNQKYSCVCVCKKMGYWGRTTSEKIWCTATTASIEALPSHLFFLIKTTLFPRNSTFMCCWRGFCSVICFFISQNEIRWPEYTHTLRPNIQNHRYTARIFALHRVSYVRKMAPFKWKKKKESESDKDRESKCVSEHRIEHCPDNMSQN